VKLFAAIAFALFPMTAPVAAPAQSPDVTLLTPLCQDDYYEDTAGRCADIYASEVLTERDARFHRGPQRSCRSATGTAPLAMSTQPDDHA
jgi:hypothetical protein